MNAQTDAKTTETFRTTVSIPAVLKQPADGFLRKHGFTSLSDYLAACLRRDVGLDPFMARREIAMQ